jgi:hypothetical protein
MNVSSVKKAILEVLWNAGKPLHRESIAERIALPANSTMGHLLGLIKADYVSVAKKNYYEITSLGKEVLGFPTLDKNQVSNILSPLPSEKAFHFYEGLNRYAGVHASSLDDFCRKILTIDMESIRFHLLRKDFESWFKHLGDMELAKKVSLVREKKLFGEALRKELYHAVKSRRDELLNLANLVHKS